MKKLTGLLRVVILSTLFFVNQPASAQTLKEFFNSSEVPVTWLGIDFTQVKVLNDINATPIAVREQFTKINELVLKEPNNFTLTRVFNKTDIVNDISFVNAKNAKTDTEKLTEDAKDERLDKSAIESVVKGYDFGDKKGLGIIFIAETLNKASLIGSYYVTIIDIGSKKVLLTERMTGKPAGFGFRNYWAKTIKDILLQIEKGKYREWKAVNG
ncbi:MAG: hypothetical protein KIT80_15795 [Chitinophagaceae bacterium]|nr:hypothetical protein [Chitinophagaceae bacterium]MCW5928379.1 hypothetical protein [Chitinophagaceae bacterium]